MRHEHAWPQQCWKSCANGCNIVALRFDDHGTKEMLGVVGWKVCRFQTLHNNMQQGVQTDATCNIQQCWELLASNVASVSTGLKASPTGLAVRMISSSEDSLLLSIQYGLLGNMTTRGLTKLLHKKGRKGRGITSLMFPFNDRPIRLTQCCTQFKSLYVFYLHYNVAFTFKWHGNSWNKTFYSQKV